MFNLDENVLVISKDAVLGVAKVTRIGTITTTWDYEVQLLQSQLTLKLPIQHLKKLTPLLEALYL